MGSRQISVLIVDDSAVACQLLTFILQQDPEINVLGSVSNGLEAIKFLENQAPDVILMDINMPKMNGFETTRHIMRNRPIPIIICSGEYKATDVDMSFKAIEAGALAILEKPKGPQDPNFTFTVKKYIEAIKTVSEVKLVTRLASAELPASDSAASTSSGLLYAKLKNVEAVGIGASLGGPQALINLLANLHAPFPVPIFIVQHITAGFTEGLISWLGTASKIPLRQAENNQRARPNTVYFAPSETQMEVMPGGIIKLVPQTSNATSSPSVAHLFKSMAATYKDRSIGVILTGMGRDGVNELLLMKEAGAITVAQSENNCLMFGMPREAISIGAATQVLDLDKIPSFLNQVRGP